jgi:thiol-disulfide isomerase/thioredoxin
MMNRLVFSLVLASTFGLAACELGDASGGPAADSGFAGVDEGCTTTADCIGELECAEDIVGEGGLCAELFVGGLIADPEKNPIHDDCAFSADLQGTAVGDHIKNFSLKTVDNEEYNLHSQNCGQPQKAALYVILGTGWCGACEAYAPRGEALYQAYKDAGLEILWIESENEKAEPVTLEWLSNWRDEKGTTFPLTRDLSFAHTYGAMAHASTSLPHLYILDPVTMTLVYAAGGGSKWDEAEGIVADLLGVDMPLYNQ